MKKADVKIGEIYLAKVSGQICRIKVIGESRYGGWDGRNLSTGRDIRIKTAARLRRTVSGWDVRKRTDQVAVVPGPTAIALLVKVMGGCSGAETSYGTKEDWDSLERAGYVTKMKYGGMLGHPFFYDLTDAGREAIKKATIVPQPN